MFIDRVKMKLKAGNGGNGLVAFRREKYVPLGLSLIHIWPGLPDLLLCYFHGHLDHLCLALCGEGQKASGKINSGW